MDAVRVLLVVLCFAVAGRGWLPDSGVVEDEVGKEVAEVRKGTGNDHRAAAGLVVEAAQKEIGVKESLENSGKRVDEYNAYVGLRKVAWCASFVSWCHWQAGYPQPRTAWSPALFPASIQVAVAWSRSASRSEFGTRSRNDGVGLVLGIYYPEKGRIAHCGLVERIYGDWCYSIEGNTNVNGGREGDGVYRKIRHKRTIHAYADWTGGTER